MAMRPIDAMTDFRIPPELLQKCTGLVAVSHQEHGFRGLPARLTSRDSMIVLALVPGMLQVMQGVSAGFKMRVACWFVGLVLVALSWFTTWWALIGVLVTVIIERSLARSERKSWEFLAAVLLSLDVLVDDFAGWGTAFPNEQAAAREILVGRLSPLKLEWLEFYLPRRTGLSSDMLQGFRPARRLD
jgi:hypothetical protein